MRRKILIITAFPPNNKTAGQNYTKNLIINLENYNWQVDIITFNFNNHECYQFKKAKYIHIEKINILKKFLNAIKIPFLHPFFTCRFSFKVLFKMISVYKNYDIIYFDFSQIFIYSLFINTYKKNIFMVHDVIYQKYLRKNKSIIYFFELLFIKFSERLLLKNKRNKYILTFSKKDMSILKTIYNCNSEIVDFYIDKKIKTIRINKTLQDYFCFFGAWNRYENLYGLLWFFNKVYPILKLDNKVKIKIIGSGIDKCKKLLKNNNQIEIVGYVENPYKIIANSKGLIAPIFYGAGVKMKVIESLACGTPVVGSALAFEGIDFSHDLIINVNSPEEYVKALNKLLKVTYKEKINLRKNFNKIYQKNTFLDFLRNRVYNNGCC